MGADPVVFCYAGYRGDETPRRIKWDQGTLLVEKIVSRWVTPEYRCFRIVADNGGLYRLFCRQADGTWDIRPDA